MQADHAHSVTLDMSTGFCLADKSACVSCRISVLFAFVVVLNEKISPRAEQRGGGGEQRWERQEGT